MTCAPVRVRLLVLVAVAVGAVVALPSGASARSVRAVNAGGLRSTNAASATTTAVQTVPGVDLQAVACPTVTTCVAVGLTANAELALQESAINVDGAVVVTITNGVPGPVELLPVPSQLYGIACPTTTMCEAVGGGAFGTSVGPGGLMATITPGATNQVQSVTETNSGSLNSVACANSTSCMAVTGAWSTGTYGQLVTIVNGIPNPPQTVDFPVSSVACASATMCEAVGSTISLSNPAPPSGHVGVVTITNGVAGPSQVTPGYLTISGIACSSSLRCQAVGQYYYGLTGRTTEPGERGAVVPIVNGVPGEAQLTPGIKQLLGVACAGATGCRAVGYQDRAVPQPVAKMVPITNGTPDAVEPVAGTGSLGHVELLSIACPSTTTCEAVGFGAAPTGVNTLGPATGLTVAITPGTPTPVPPTIANFTYPVEGQSAVSTEEAFSWSTVPAAQAYRFTAGTTPGATDLSDSGVLAPSAYSYLEPVMPPGPTLYATVYTELDGVWRSQSVSFTVAPSQASFTGPWTSALTSKLSVDPTATFTWSTIPQAQGYILVIGTTNFGTNVAFSGALPASQLAYTPPILPPNTTLHATLLTKVNGAFSRFQTITFATGPIAATFLTPYDGEAGVTSQWFNWTTRAQAQNYIIVIGTTPLGTNVYFSGLLGAYNWAVVPALPKGKSLYATLFTKIQGAWYYQAITFTA